MSAKTYEFDYIRVFIEPDQQGIAFYMTLHSLYIRLKVYEVYTPEVLEYLAVNTLRQP